MSQVDFKYFNNYYMSSSLQKNVTLIYQKIFSKISDQKLSYKQ